MNTGNPGQRFRGPSNGTHVGPASRPAQEPRNVSDKSPPMPNGNNAPGVHEMSRAEKFEDEKKRIIDSCFGKTEQDGSASESYITHIRIDEDAAYPSAPPPSNSAPENKKPRIIIVAVRKSGRVRMHKARENNNGSFSIGKTWVLDDLTAIESYSNCTPTNAEEQQSKQRAGDIGFVITIQKPYYWQSSTRKEKDFFLFSLVKIFRKYTGGRLPELVGFNNTELDALGVSTQALSDQPAGHSNGVSDPTPRNPNQDAPIVHEPKLDMQPPDSNRERRRRPSQERQSQERTLPSTLRSGPTERSVRTAVSNDRFHMPGGWDSSESMSHQPSQAPLRPKRSESPGSRSVRSQQQSLRSQLSGPHSEEPRDDQDLLAPKSMSSGIPSIERARENGTYRPGNRMGSPNKQRSETPDARPLTALRDEVANSSSLSINDPRMRKPSPFSQKSFQSDRSNSTQDVQRTREPSPERQNGQSQNHLHAIGSPEQDFFTPPMDPPESPKNNPYSDNRPTTSSSQAKDLPSMDSFLPSTTYTTESPSTQDPPTPKFPPTPPPETPTESEVHRPGLGPMIKKKSTKEIATQFRKAAAAHNAFKPRAKGAVDKVPDGDFAGGDGITGVFQAPSLLRGVSQDESRPVTRPATPNQKQDTQPLSLSPEVKKDTLPTQLAVSPQRPVTPIIQEPPPPKHVDEPKPSDNTEKLSVPLQDERRKKRRSDHSAKYAQALGINPSQLEGRTAEIESILNDFGWGEDSSERTTYEELGSGIRKEIARVEAGSWLGILENNDDRVTAVGEMMDKVIEECEELDCLLTLYNVELGTLSEDVAYIEAQSQGLQVQTANQKLLQIELRNLLDTIAISSSELRILQDAPLEKARGVIEVEGTLTKLHAALLTIDPRLRQAGPRPVTSDQAAQLRNSSAGYGGSELSSMNAVREKREGYRQESLDFLQRLRQFISIKFTETESRILGTLESHHNSKSNTKLDDRLREEARRDLWLYSPLMLFAREMEPSEWDDMMRSYEGCAKRPYKDEFRDNIFAWKRITRKPAGDEQEVLFTHQEKEKENESIVGRKLTVKRAKTVRGDGSSRISSGDKPKDGKVTAYEAFAGALAEMARIIFIEQNFVVDIFHASSLDTQDFAEAVATDPEHREREGGQLMIKKPSDPDRNMAKKVQNVMDEIYSFWPQEVQSLVDWAVKQDPLNGVGVLFALESQQAEIEDTNQDFLTQGVTKIHDRLVTQFTRFIEDQIRGIEDTKVKIKKRKGVIAFMKTFPHFCLAVENMLPPTRNIDHLLIRSLVNEAYQSLNKSMFESLKFIAKENPTAQQTQPITTGDPEDKEALNHHILLIENMNHYIEEVPVRNNPVLEDWNLRAKAEMADHLNLYLSSVIRRPLGKLLDFVESTESLLVNHSGPPASIATRASHSRSVFKKILGSHDAKETRRGIETLKKRVEKHFGEGDDTAGLSRELVGKVLKECEGRYLGIGERVANLVTEVYEGSLDVEWRREDIVAAFRR